jgi:multisubunit Na+/H+ antiporter MnhC subunit
MIGFPVMQNAVNLTLAAINGTITRGNIKPGWTYRVVSTVDCWLSYETAAIVGAGCYLPANKPTYMTFGGADSQGTAIELNAIAGGAGTLNLVPIMRVTTF